MDKRKLPIGAAIRALRLDRGLTQLQVAGRMPCPRPYLTKIELGHNTPNLYQIEKFARALEVKTYLLLLYAELLALADLIPDTALAGKKRPVPGMPPRWQHPPRAPEAHV